MDASTEREALAEVARRLTGRFQQLPPDLVTRIVDEFAEQLQTAKIRDFVPLLVERRARDQLQAHLAAVVVPSSSDREDAGAHEARPTLPVGRRTSSHWPVASPLTT